MNRLRRQQERIRSEEETAYRDFQEASEALERLQSRLRASSSKLVRLRKQQKLLDDRGFSILDRELSSESVAALEEEDRRLLERLAAGESSDPDNSEGPSASKRPRHEAVGPAAPQAAESAESTGEPVAGARSPHSPELVNSARFVLDPALLEGFPSFSFEDGLASAGDGSL